MRRALSPYYDYRPDDEIPTPLMVHNISLPPGEFGDPRIDASFIGTTDPQTHPFFAKIAHLRVFTRCLVRRDDEIVQYVPFDKRAWHAGVSQYQGRERCNDFSIGTGLGGTDTLAYTDVQYQQLAAVMRVLIDCYLDVIRNMTGHCNTVPDRKTGPGSTFDWARFRALVSKRTT